VSLLEVSVQAGDLGPVIVLAGDADGSPATELGEALTVQVSPGATYLAIDATNLRSLDPAAAQTLMTAALIVMARGGRTVLVNPQEPVLKMLRHLPAQGRYRSVPGAPGLPRRGRMRQPPVMPGPASARGSRPDAAEPGRASEGTPGLRGHDL